MLHVDRAPGVQLVTDRPGQRGPVKKAVSELEPGDKIVVSFAAYGDLIATVRETHERPASFGSLTDIRVEAPATGDRGSFGTTTVRLTDSDILTYPKLAEGTWL